MSEIVAVRSIFVLFFDDEDRVMMINVFWKEPNR